ncbi:hypothetical protein ACLOJK_008645 [Asimina triloba]
MAECFNEKSGISGSIPLGSFNSMFNFTGSWRVDAAATKSLVMDGYFVPLYKDVTVIFRRRGGDDLIQSHAAWANTVHLAPDVINMTFSPIISLLNGLPGIKHLARAIDLYLEYKPPIEELQYFLEFQIPRVWAPEQNNHPGQRKEPVCPHLQFSLMGPKLYISSEQDCVKEEKIKQKKPRISIKQKKYEDFPKT